MMEGAYFFGEAAGLAAGAGLAVSFFTFFFGSSFFTSDGSPIFTLLHSRVPSACFQ